MANEKRGRRAKRGRARERGGGWIGGGAWEDGDGGERRRWGAGMEREANGARRIERQGITGGYSLAL